MKFQFLAMKRGFAVSLKLSFEAGFVLALESKFPLKISVRK